MTVGLITNVLAALIQTYGPKGAGNPQERFDGLAGAGSQSASRHSERVNAHVIPRPEEAVLDVVLK